MKSDWSGIERKLDQGVANGSEVGQGVERD